MDKSLRVKITNVATLVLLMFCLIGYTIGWVNPSPLFCPDNSSLTLQTRNVDVSRGGVERTHTVSAFDCVDVHGISVPNNADKIFGLVCVLPFFLLLFWGVASSLFGTKKKQGVSSRKKDRKQSKALAARNHELEEYFQFIPADLAQNKNGFVSESQKRKLRYGRLEKAFRTSIFPILVILTFLAYLRLRGATMFISASGLYIAPLLVIIIGAIFFPAFKKMDFSLKSAQGKVNLVDVMETTQVEERMGNEHFGIYPVRKNKVVKVTEMRIGAEAFSVNEALLEIVHQGDICCVYYIGSGDIVSMEFLL